MLLLLLPQGLQQFIHSVLSTQHEAAIKAAYGIRVLTAAAVPAGAMSVSRKSSWLLMCLLLLLASAHTSALTDATSAATAATAVSSISASEGAALINRWYRLTAAFQRCWSNTDCSSGTMNFCMASSLGTFQGKFLQELTLKMHVEASITEGQMHKTGLV
jgi:hypothetical protein